MPVLKIDFNCMCLYVTNGEPSVVHVLMPSTAGPGEHGEHTEHGEHHKDHQHLARLLYRSCDGQVVSKPMEDWALTLRRGPAAQGNVPASAEAILAEKLVVNLSDLTNSRVDPELLTGSGAGKIVSRVSIHGGAIEAVMSQKHRWTLGTHNDVMAHQITWRVDDVQLEWTPLSAATQGASPLPSLADVKPEDDAGEVFHVYVYHVLEQDLPSDLPPPPDEETLNKFEIMDHFPMYYPLLNDVRMGEQLVPYVVDEDGPGVDVGGGPSGTYLCKSAQALV